MTKENTRSTAGDDTTEMLKSVLKSQYHAALAMLRQGIELCPDTLWVDRDAKNPFWRVAYHALYYTHLYSQQNAQAFTPWEHHQTGIHDLDDVPAPSEIQELTEHPHRPPQTGKPYTKEQVLGYWNQCSQMVDGAVAAMDILSQDSGFAWYRISKLEHQIVSVRHIQHHAAQLGDRIRAFSNVGVEWVGARRP